MSDKDQFTFDDDDDFPETDLSSAFSDGEQEADNPAPEVEAEPEPEPGVKAKKNKKEKKSSSVSGSRTRALLIILLLVVGGAAGAYYFMDLGGTTPSVPTVAAPAKKKVALPPKPAKAPAAAQATAKAEPSKPVKVAVPPPPPPAKTADEPVAKPAAKPAEQAAPTKQLDTVAKPAEQKALAKPAAKTTVAAPVPKPAPSAEVKKTTEKTVAVESPKTKVASVAMPPATKPASQQAAAAVAAPKQVADGNFALDAGSYLFESNRNALIEKIKKLGYEPLVTPVDAKLDMTRLRLGTFSKSEVQEALAFARSIESGAYSAPAGDNYVIYAGTFLGKGNVDRLTRRFNEEGIKVHPEPVQVVRTLSRIRFGSFATKADASDAAATAAQSGVKTAVVKSK